MNELIKSPRVRSCSQRGSALVMALFVLILVTGMGTALLFLSRNEVRMSQASLLAKQAFYIAEAGQEAGRLTLFANNGNGSFDDDLLAAAGLNGVIDFDPDAVRPVFDSSGALTGFTGYGDDVPLVPATPFGDGWYIAFLTNDPGEPSPFHLNTADSNERLMITGLASGPRRSFETVQAIVEMTQIFPAMPPATITLLGPSPYFDGGASAAKEYIGNDCKGAGVGGLYVPIVGVIGSEPAVNPCPPSADSVVCGIVKPKTYKTGYGAYSGGDTVADVTDPGVIGGIGPIDADWNDCRFLDNLVREVREAADVVCPSGRMDRCPNMPPSSPSRVIFVNGDFFIDPWDGGEGLVLATGELALHGDTEWRGMLLAVGQGRFSRFGSGKGSVSGAIFAANISGPDDIYGTADDCSGGPGGFRRSSFDMAGGGNGDDTFCSKHILAALPVKPYEIVDFLQR